jgi:cell division inhibitor SepF
MGFLDNLRDRLRGDDGYYDDYDEYDEEFDEEYPEEPRRATSGLLGNTSRPEAESVSVYTRSGRPVEENLRSPSAGGFSTSQRYSEDVVVTQDSYRDVPYTPAPAPAPSYNAPQVTRQTSGQLPPYVLRPTTYDDVEMVIRRVRTNQPVVLSFKGTQIDTAKRILDFCFGLACGIDGGVEEIGDRVFVVLPAGIALSQADLDKLTRDGILGR